jgi:hypothetical protein
MKLTSFLLWLLAAVAFGVTSAGAQSYVYFTHNPTANRCADPQYSLRVNFRDRGFIDLPPQGNGEVISGKSVVSLLYKGRQFVPGPQKNPETDPGAVCFFSKCEVIAPGSILLTCGGTWPDRFFYFGRVGGRRK